MNNVHKFEGRPVSTKDKYGIQNLEDVRGQLEAQAAAYNNAIKELKEGNTTNIDLLKETRKVLVDLREIVVELSGGSAEDVAVAKQVAQRLSELDETMNEAETKKAKLA